MYVQIISRYYINKISYFSRSKRAHWFKIGSIFNALSSFFFILFQLLFILYFVNLYIMFLFKVILCLSLWILGMYFMNFSKIKVYTVSFLRIYFNPLNPELNPICHLLALLGAHHFLHVSRIRVKLLTFRRLMSYIYIYGAPIPYVSRSHTTTQHSR